MENPHVLYPTLYVPATLPCDKIARLMNGERNDVNRMVIDTEDAVLEQDLQESLTHVQASFHNYHPIRPIGIFLRPRNHEVMQTILDMSGVTCLEGFVIPKADPSRVRGYTAYGDTINSFTDKKFRVMPILESAAMIDIGYRRELLQTFKAQEYRDRIDCLRIGINDMMGQQNMRHDSELTIYETTIGILFGTIVNEFRGNDGFTITAPVFDGFGPLYTDLFKREVRRHIASNLFGQTIIHTSQMQQVADLYKVTEDQLAAATSLTSEDAAAVRQSAGRMDEKTTHSGWAGTILLRANMFGVMGDKLSDTSSDEQAA
jgi:citrate lyase beta subunit